MAPAAVGATRCLVRRRPQIAHSLPEPASIEQMLACSLIGLLLVNASLEQRMDLQTCPKLSACSQATGREPFANQSFDTLMTPQQHQNPAFSPFAVQTWRLAHGWAWAYSPTYLCNAQGLQSVDSKQCTRQHVQGSSPSVTTAAMTTRTKHAEPQPAGPVRGLVPAESRSPPILRWRHAAAGRTAVHIITEQGGAR